MKRKFLSLYALSRLGALILVANLCLVQDGAAQIKMSSDGNVSVGTDPSTSTMLRVIDSNTNVNSYGIWATNSVGSNPWGIRATVNNGSTGRAFYGTAANANTNYGVFGRGSGGNTNYGIYGSAFGGSTANYAGYFSGDVVVTGDINPPSDARLKNDVRSLQASDAIDRLLQLNPTSFAFRPEYEFMNLPTGIRYGFVAQELEAVFPELVKEHIHPGEVDEEGHEVREEFRFKGVDYLSLIPILVQAVQEQQEQIDAMRAAIEANGITVE